ncbi:metal ABC transporter substrate-binding protein [Niallia taxi]|uniref:Zinc ABC transporter substrate-binding protein n=1 Tax=Niallia taxi TaxID=2499688 RepID=A0A437KGC1_9BACI|nr:metal ABC transporter substrate-binding protein [Niallia taxi]MCM3214979.1 metal ABC transporter substrate-binding protein [Niallia taxi]MDK8638881.1 metal ABC transporter substrate-binding protein [Niallia taxi]MED4053497.1 metal ABC transporter substrate-binding protein [Niallia taxi]MED4119337.1 metal ABC transporter substrate-binding protein [Niallia taxi]RVT67314.1 zinc ABC transporter substrate-binding protein [Niallia taxi]
MKKRYGLLLVSMIVLILAACSNDTSEKEDDGKLKIMTTFYPMYEFTKNIAGDKADVELLIPSTIEPHDWEPTPKDIGNIQKADLFVYNSADMETWVSDITASIDSSDVAVVEASKGIKLIEEDEEAEESEEEHEHEHSHHADPHVWLSPVLAQQEVQTITDALVKVDPDNKEYYETESSKYIEKLKALDEEYKTELKGITSNEFITQHTAFSYLAKEYGLVQVPIAGLSPDEEPSAAKLAELKKFAEEHEINVIYFEELTSSKVAETLANELGADTEVLNALEGLSDEQQKAGEDYITVMEENLTQLKKSFFE